MYLAVICFVAALFFGFKYYRLKSDISDLSDAIGFRKQVNSPVLISHTDFCREADEIAARIQDIVDYYDGIRIENAREMAEYEKMVTDVTHDLRTPLTSALGHLELLETDDARIEIIREKLLRLSETINKFYEIAKSVSEKEMKEMEILDLSGLIFEEVSVYYDDLESRGISLSLSVPHTPVQVVSDDESLRVIIQNLMDNVCAYGKDNCEVELLTGGDRNILRISNGWDRVDVDRNLFGRGVTLDVSRSKGSTGFGLSIVQMRARAIGAEINLIAEEKFIVELII